jgi:hypothetical protein
MQQKYDEVMEKLHSVSKQLSEAQKHDRATSHLVAEVRHRG